MVQITGSNRRFKLAIQTGEDLVGGSADIQKAFDEIQRDLLYDLLEDGGLPERILEPYRRFQEGLKIFNEVNGTAGELYQRPCSIPQGDPFSMAWVAYLMRPWVLAMRARRLASRVLADDLQVHAKGTGALQNFRRGFKATIMYVLMVWVSFCDQCFVDL